MPGPCGTAAGGGLELGEDIAQRGGEAAAARDGGVPRWLATRGPRPEGIKLAPFVEALRLRGGEIDVRVILTGQHTTLIQQVLSVFRLDIARDLGIEVREDNLLRSDLYLADEAFLTGTAAEIVPMRSVDDREIGDPGEITKDIQATYFAVVHGEEDRYKEWLHYVNT